MQDASDLISEAQIADSRTVHLAFHQACEEQCVLQVSTFPKRMLVKIQ